jgi:esterase
MIKSKIFFSFLKQSSKTIHLAFRGCFVIFLAMKLNYRTSGSKAPALVILHGLLGSLQNWHSVAQRLSQTHRIVFPDLRNHGDSPHGVHRIELMVQDVIELLNHEESEQVFVIGHSMGGMVAMSMATRAPERLHGLVIVDIAPQIRMSDMDEIFEPLLNLDLSQLQRRDQATEALAPDIKSPAVRQFLLQNLKRLDSGQFGWRCNLAELQRFVKDGRRFELAAEAHYDGPTLFIAGGTSEYRIWERENAIRQHFPKAGLVVVPKAGHWVHFEAMEEFIDIVDEFVKSAYSGF